MDAANQRLKHLRGTRQICRVARELGITEQALRDYEAGKRRPRDEILSRMALFYRVPLAYLRGPVFFLTRECTKSAQTKRTGRSTIFLS